jgi:hypothetical protein
MSLLFSEVDKLASPRKLQLTRVRPFLAVPIGLSRSNETMLWWAHVM